MEYGTGRCVIEVRVARYLLVFITLRKVEIGELLVETESAKYSQIGERRCQARCWVRRRLRWASKEVRQA